MKRYYLSERSTGAMDGCYSDKANAERAAKSLGSRHEGSSWNVMPVCGSVGMMQQLNPGYKFPPDSRWHGNDPMLSKLEALSK
jgi:hypothetical protein